MEHKVYAADKFTLFSFAKSGVVGSDGIVDAISATETTTLLQFQT